MAKKTKIMLLVSNDLVRDPRVTKQAKTGVIGGYETLVACWAYGENHPPLIEKKDGYLIHRGLFNPFWTPKLFFLNLGLAKYNLSLIRKYLIIRLKKTYQFYYLALRYIFYKIPAKIIRWFFARIAKVLHKQIQPGFLKTRLAFLKTSPKIQSEIINNTSDKSKPLIAHNNFVPSMPQKDTLLIKFIKTLNIYRYYHHYYKSMYTFMIDEGVKFQPDIIHANDLDTLLAGYLIKRKTGARLIYDAHEIWTEQGLAYPKIINWIFKVLEKFLFRKIDHFITVNQSIADVLDHTYRLPRNLKQTIIFNCPRYEKCEFQPHRSQKIIALYQGRYSPNRGLEQIVQSAKYLNPGIELHFRGLGDDKLLAEMKKTAQEIGRKNVKFHPPVEMKDLVQSARNADIGLIAYLPVHIDNELCMPNKVFEYMMAGLALAVSDLPELRRLVKEYDLGATFDPYNPKDIAKKINQVAGGDLLRLRQNALKAAKICSWETEEKKLIKIYKGLI